MHQANSLHPTSHLGDVLVKSLVALFMALGCVQSNLLAADGHWVTTWGCAPQVIQPGNLPPVPLANSTLRQFVRTTVGGELIRVRFSNAYGTSAVSIKASRVALSSSTASAGTATSIRPPTRRSRFAVRPLSSFFAAKWCCLIRLNSICLR